MTKLIYQSPKKVDNRRLSAPIDENDLRARAVLEARKWTVVERIEDDELEADVEGQQPPAEVVADAAEPVVEMPEEVVQDLQKTKIVLPEAVEAALVEAGYSSYEDVVAASDEELLAIAGIGKKTVAKIREALA